MKTLTLILDSVRFNKFIRQSATRIALLSPYFFPLVIHQKNNYTFKFVVVSQP